MGFVEELIMISNIEEMNKIFINICILAMGILISIIMMNIIITIFRLPQFLIY
jgi:hypothetical protein